MADFKPTAEQTAIINAAKNETHNLAVIARAGAAKTSTLVLIAEAIPEVDILCLAFNKAIATEMNERLPDNCEAKTLHALGYKAWWQFVRTKCSIDGQKMYKIMQDLIKDLDPADRDEAYENFAETLNMISQGKNAGWLPEKYRGHWKPLISDMEFFGGLEFEPTELQEELCKAASIKSFQAALTGSIDFDDMVFCPGICSVSWPSPSLTMIDEAQDLSPLNHHTLKKIVRNRRIIAVGDPFQAIYGFRGADAKSMDRIREMFDMETLKLTISFRCARTITENARWRADDMQYPEWAEEGEVLRPHTWAAEEILDGDAIICRNNAPLFSIAIKLIKQGRLPEIAGRDIGKALEKVMKKLGKDNMPREAAVESLRQWRDKELRRARNGAQMQIHDRYQCIYTMLEQTKTLGEARVYLNHLLQREGRIKLMTGHKSKGLEFDNVWFLDQWLCKKEYDQDANIKYVIETRAKKKLVYVESDTFDDETN